MVELCCRNILAVLAGEPPITPLNRFHGAVTGRAAAPRVGPRGTVTCGCGSPIGPTT